MAEVMMSLGNYRFSLDTAAYEAVKRTLSLRWQSQARLLRQPAQQFVGVGEELIELSGVIYPHFRGGLQQIDELRREAVKGEPLLLVDGFGDPWGLWVVLSLQETQSFFLSQGVARKQTFSLTLRHYGEDR